MIYTYKDKQWLNHIKQTSVNKLSAASNIISSPKGTPQISGVINQSINQSINQPLFQALDP